MRVLHYLSNKKRKQRRKEAFSYVRRDFVVNFFIDGFISHFLIQSLSCVSLKIFNLFSLTFVMEEVRIFCFFSQYIIWMFYKNAMCVWIPVYGFLGLMKVNFWISWYLIISWEFTDFTTNRNRVFMIFCIG